jgi:hypothetical protein
MAKRIRIGHPSPSRIPDSRRIEKRDAKQAT